MSEETTGERIAREFFEETKPRFTQPVVNCQLSDPIDAEIAKVERERDEARALVERVRARVLRPGLQRLLHPGLVNDIVDACKGWSA